MKLFILSFIISAILLSSSRAIGPEDIAKFYKAHEQCMEKGKVDDEIIGRVLQGELVNDQPFDCYVACMLENIGLSNSDGSLNAELAISKIPTDIEIHDELEKAIRNCSSQKGDDKCSTAHMIFVCIHESKVPDLLL